MAERGEPIRDAASKLIKARPGRHGAVVTALGKRLRKKSLKTQLSQMLSPNNEARLPASALLEIVAVSQADPFSELLWEARKLHWSSLRGSDPMEAAARAALKTAGDEAHDQVARSLKERFGWRVDQRRASAILTEMLQPDRGRPLPAEAILDIVRATGIDPFTSLLRERLHS